MAFKGEKYWGWVTTSDFIIDTLWWLKFQLYYRPKWRLKNKHNRTYLAKPCFIDKISVGNYSFWPLDCRIAPQKSCYIKIWSFCCIWPDVKFVCLVNHPMDRLLDDIIWSYLCPHWVNPFWKFKWHIHSKKDIEIIKKAVSDKAEKSSHGPIILWDDVWIWTSAIIMAWVHIWQWAVIAAWAVVTKDVPPYAIVWWIPAKVIKYRFSENIIKKLLQIDFSEVSMQQLSKIYPQLITDKFDVDYIIKELNKKY